MAINNAPFQASPALLQRLVVLVLLALSVMWMDYRWSWLQPVRYYTGYVLLPAQQMSLFPSIIANWFGESATSRQQLIHENKQLQAHNLILEVKAQRLASLETENIELRELLSASEQVGDRVLVAAITAIHPDPYSRQILINRGGQDDVFIGQPVLDAYGLLGQVVDVLPQTSRVLMIADANHAIPVQINRNGVRAIAVGTGALDQLELIYVPNTTDIIVGDLLVSSGLGGRYPSGYPVARVTKVTNVPGQQFATVYAEPSAQLDRSRHLLLVFNERAGQVPPASIWQGAK